MLIPLREGTYIRMDCDDTEDVMLFEVESISDGTVKVQHYHYKNGNELFDEESTFSKVMSAIENADRIEIDNKLDRLLGNRGIGTVK